jgi:hypothetical protein
MNFTDDSYLDFEEILKACEAWLERGEPSVAPASRPFTEPVYDYATLIHMARTILEARKRTVDLVQRIQLAIFVEPYIKRDILNAKTETATQDPLSAWLPIRP